MLFANTQPLGALQYFRFVLLLNKNCKDHFPAIL